MRPIVLAVAFAMAISGARAADDRSLLDHCKTVVAQPSTDSVEVQHCRQVIKEWTLRDSRMSVDEDGRPLR